MGKYCEHSDIDPTTHSHTDTEQQLPQTLANLLQHLPKSQPHHPRTHQSHPLANSRKWSHAQTANFYKLLHHFGLDFTLMSYHPLFRGRRSQKQLCSKYKKEGKKNPGTMDCALTRIEQQGLFHGI